LTKDGKKTQNAVYPSKIQRVFANKTIAGNPVKLAPKGENDGFIYVTEGIENGLSIQEHINNEVWCSLSIVNILTLPFERNKKYIFVFDNDDSKPKKDGKKSTLEDTIEKLGKYKRQKRQYNKNNNNNSDNNNSDNNNDNNREHYYFFYLKPSVASEDANDLHKQGKLKDFLNTLPTQIITSNVKTIIKKEEIKKLLNVRSPDLVDALALTFSEKLHATKELNNELDYYYDNNNFKVVNKRRF
jgi:hypothetical protein